MRTLLWSITLLTNIAVTGVAFVLAFTSGESTVARLVAVVVGVLAAGVTLLLVLAKWGRMPAWGRLAMRVLCVTFPLLWLLGSLDLGILSGQEVLSVVLVAALYWGTWRVFRSSLPSAV